MKCVLYLRVSSSEQHTDNQRLTLEGYARTRDWEVVDTYREDETAWKAGYQKELSRLMYDYRNGHKRIDIVLVWALDRLTR